MFQVDEQFDELMRQVLAGSESAARELFRDYEPHLLHIIRRRLNKKIRPKFDSVDFAQDVWASFFAERLEQRVFKTPGDLVAFLTRLAQNKVADATRKRLKGKKYNVNREKSLDDSRRFNKDAVASAHPTPSQILMTHEEWLEFLKRQPLVYQRVYILMREGKSSVQIAQELGISLRTVQRAIARLDTEAAS